MGGFHIILCLMRCIYSRFKGFGFPELLSEVGLGGSGTIEKALKGGDVKEGIRYYKFLFEAVYRIKLDACGIDNNLENSPDVSRLLARIDEAANDLNFEVIENDFKF